MNHDPWRVRFRVPLTLLPPVAGLIVAVALWDSGAEIEFFAAATEVLAIGAVGMALSGRFFRLSIHLGAGPVGGYVIINIVSVLVAVGLGLGFAFRALADGHSTTGDVGVVSGALTTGIAAFAVQALFGTPGLAEDDIHQPPEQAG